FSASARHSARSARAGSALSGVSTTGPTSRPGGQKSRRRTAVRSASHFARANARPFWFLLTDRYEDPQRWRRFMSAVHGARAKGLSFTAQIAGRPIGVMMGIGTALNPFTVRPSYKAIEHLPIEEQRRRLRDPEMRRRVLNEKPSDAEVAKLAQFRQLIVKRFDKFFTMGNPPDYEPGPEKSVAAIAARTGKSPDEV